MEIKAAHTGIIIQARIGSSRMPGKVLLPFSGERTILDIILSHLRRSAFRLPVCIATSVSEKDDVIAAFAEKNKVLCFRGDEDDVLKRFIDAAEKNGFEKIVRVCADNPFLDSALLDELLDAALQGDADYYSYEVNENLPAIRSHWGIFTEFVTLAALKKAAGLTNEKFYHEHVTNFIYGHPGLFTCRWIKAPSLIFGREDVRFTIDTADDFRLIQRIWKVLEERRITVNFRHALQVLEEFPEMKSAMQEQIRVNSK